MGGFFLAVGLADSAKALADKARSQFDRSGLGKPTRVVRSDYVLDHYAKHGQDVGNLIHLDESDFLASVGTLVYKKQTGTPALHSIAAEQDLAGAIAECHGHFALIMRRSGKTTILRDALSTYQVYYDEDLGIISTSFLALAQCLPRCTMRISECIEYVVWATTFGAETPVKEIQRLDLGQKIILDPAPRITGRTTVSVPPQSPAPFADQLALVLSATSDCVQSVAEAFDGKTTLGFSGGYDSRLLFALLRSHGVTPSLFVYGAETSADVRVAREIAAGEGVELGVVNKGVFRPVTLENFPDMFRLNYNWYDGFCKVGLFHSDAEALLMEKRSRPPGVVLLGAAGEIFRNFFRLPNREISPPGFVRAIGQFDPKILAVPSLHALYENHLADKISALFDSDKRRLDGRRVAALYPYFRSQSWHARGISVASRFGDFAQPYHDPRVVDAVLRLPVKWKHFGNFEASMIRAVDPHIAKYVSSYGFSFAGRTPLRGMLNDLALYALPPDVRKYNFRARRRLFGRQPRWPTLERPFLASVLDPTFPIMSRFFNIDRVEENGQFDRLAALEYMFQQLNVRAEHPELQSAG